MYHSGTIAIKNWLLSILNRCWAKRFDDERNKQKIIVALFLVQNWSMCCCTSFIECNTIFLTNHSLLILNNGACHPMNKFAKDH